MVATRNRLALLREALHSLRAQRGCDLEVVVVDDGSTDGTPEEVERAGDCRVRLLRATRPGSANRARNEGLAAARAPRAAFCDDDDVWAPDKLTRQVEALEVTGSAWCYSGAIEVDARLRPFRGAPTRPPAEVLTGLPYRNEVPGGTSNVLFDRKLVLELGGMEPSFTHLADWDLWIRLARRGAPAAVPAPLVGYRRHGSNEGLRTADLWPELDELERRTADLRPGRPVDRAMFLREEGSGRLRAGHRGAASASYLRAIRAGDRPARHLLPTVALPVAIAHQLRRRRLPDEWLAEAEGWLAPLRRELSAAATEARA